MGMVFMDINADQLLDRSIHGGSVNYPASVDAAGSESGQMHDSALRSDDCDNDLGILASGTIINAPIADLFLRFYPGQCQRPSALVARRPQIADELEYRASMARIANAFIHKLASQFRLLCRVRHVGANRPLPFY
jgi:hypothetical protein